MKIQFNTDHNIKGSEKMQAYFDAEIRESLSRFSPHITRIEVHLSDVNSSKSGRQDKRCTLEARVKHREPVAVSDEADTIEKAVNGATGKLKNSLNTIIERLRDH
jgi:ribosome-associated translation inhibitor RaiA